MPGRGKRLCFWGRIQFSHCYHHEFYCGRATLTDSQRSIGRSIGAGWGTFWISIFPCLATHLPQPAFLDPYHLALGPQLEQVHPRALDPTDRHIFCQKGPWIIASEVGSSSMYLYYFCLNYTLGQSFAWVTPVQSYCIQQVWLRAESDTLTKNLWGISYWTWV